MGTCFMPFLALGCLVRKFPSTLNQEPVPGRQRPVVSRQGQCAWQPGRAFCVGRGRLCMVESRGDGHRQLPCSSGPMEAPDLAL